MSGEAINVLVRLRPPGDSAEMEMERGLSEDGRNKLKSVASNHSYKFDKVLGEKTSQEYLFTTLGLKIVDALLEGINGTIFAYGQTGSGKTHSMVGPEGELSGLVPQALRYLFCLREQRVAKSAGATAIRIEATFVELYQDRIYDLLEPNGPSLVLKDGDGSPYVEGARMEPLEDYAEALDLLQRGLGNRKAAETAMNRSSSRSHAILSLRLHATTKEETGVTSILTSRLHLVDLAGSERQSQSQSEGVRLREACAINAALSHLAKVISDLVLNAERPPNRQIHVPYRNSKLTHLLRDSLGGNSRTVLLACVRPEIAYAAETANTLRFAASCRNIRNEVHANETVEGASVAALKEELARLRAQQRSQDSQSSTRCLKPLMKHLRTLRELLSLQERRADAAYASADRLRIILSHRRDPILGGLRREKGAEEKAEIIEARRREEIAALEKEAEEARAEAMAHLQALRRFNQEEEWALEGMDAEEELSAELRSQLRKISQGLDVAVKMAEQEEQRREQAEKSLESNRAEWENRDLLLQKKIQDLSAQYEAKFLRSGNAANSAILTPPRAAVTAIANMTPAQRKERRKTRFDANTSAYALASSQHGPRVSTMPSVAFAAEEESLEAKQIRRLEEEVEELSKAREEADFRVASAEAVASELESDMEKYRAKITSEMDLLATSLEQERVKAAKADDFEQRLKAVMKERETLKSEKAEAERRAEESSSAAERAERAVETMLEAVGPKEEALADAQSRCRALEAALEEAERKAAHTHSATADTQHILRSELRSLEKELSSSQEREAKWRNLLHERQKEEAVYDERLRLETEKAEAAGQEKGRAEASQELENQQREREQLMQTLVEQRSCLKEAKAEKETHNALLADLREKLSTLEMENAYFAGHANQMQKIKYVEKLALEKKKAEDKAAEYHEQLSTLRASLARENLPAPSPSEPFLLKSPLKARNDWAVLSPTPLPSRPKTPPRLPLTIPESFKRTTRSKARDGASPVQLF